MARQQRRNSLARTFKDYFVPIVGLALIVVLLWSFFGGGDDNSSQTTENRQWYALNFWDVDTEVFVEYSWGNREKVENGTEMFKGEKLIVKEWSASMKVWENTSINVDKLGEVKIGEDGSLSLFSSNMWVSSQDPLTIYMRYASVKTTAPAVVSLAQNEVSSTVYVISWTAEVSNLAWVSTLLGKGKKLSISRNDASKEDIDLSQSKTDLGKYFEESDWFLENNWPAILAQDDTPTDEEASSSWSTSTGSTTSVSDSIPLSFDGVGDGSTVSTTTVTLSGSYDNENVARIVVWGKEATLNTEDKTFTVEWVSTPEKENDLIIKMYSPDNSVLDKDVITVYSSAGTTNTSNDDLFKVENYSLDATEFQFISPKQNPYTTTDGVVMIEWRVPAGIVQKIQVNWYTLQKFSQYGTYWSYFANQEYGNLKPWLNVYEVVYIARDGSVLHSNAFTIIKNEVQATPPPTEWWEEAVISDEAEPVA